MARKCLRLSWKEELDSKVGLPYPPLTGKLIKGLIWSEGLCNPSCVHEDLRRAEAQDEKDHEKDQGILFISLLRTCGRNKDLCRGLKLHDDISRSGLLGTCWDALVAMYARCGALGKAQELLDVRTTPNVFTWNALIGGYVQKGQGQDALQCFERMKKKGPPADAVTYTCILKACGSIGAIDMGEHVHDEVAKQELLMKDVLLGNALVSMYAKCGALQRARQVLEELPLRDVVSWNALITEYAQRGQGQHALDCFLSMLNEGISPDAVTLLGILKACGSIGAADKGEKIHDEISKQGLLANNIALSNALVDMYAKCGVLDKAAQVLEECPARNIITWNALIAGYAQHDECEKAWNCFEAMQREGISPDAATFTCVLKSIGSTGEAEKGERIHDEISKQGLLGGNVLLGTALVDMYAKCGALGKAQRVLDELPVRDVISWNALLSSCVEQGENEKMLSFFEQMQHEGVHADVVSYISVLKAFGSMREAEKGEKVHDEITKQGMLPKDPALGNALVDMYAKCGAVAKAHHVLASLPVRNVISWSTIIGGYAQEKEGKLALSCFELMKRDGFFPNVVTFISILKACGSIGAIDRGEKLHDELAKQGLLGSDLVLGNSLVGMYVKCGSLSRARQVLQELPSRDAITWNTLITGSVRGGEAEKALDWFKQMQQEGFAPDATTFSCVLNACSRLGLVEDAETYMVMMGTKYGLKPDIGHYTCLVDLFARTGHLDKAKGVIEKVPWPDTGVWSALLGSCQKWGDVAVGRWAFDRAVKVDKNDAALYVLMANIYAAAGMHGDAEAIEAMHVKNEHGMKPAQNISIEHHGNLCPSLSPCSGEIVLADEGETHDIEQKKPFPKEKLSTTASGTTLGKQRRKTPKKA